MDDRILHHLNQCDEIWHAGDIGNPEVIRKLEQKAHVRAVYGNADGGMLRVEFKEQLRFNCDDVDVWMMHIGGYPSHYPALITAQLKLNPPKLFICGHSHILKIIFDPKYQMLCINPGAAGIQGFHKMRTMVRFSIEGEKIKDMEVIELGMRGVIPA
jgi:putative phosphoesterase